MYKYDHIKYNDNLFLYSKVHLTHLNLYATNYAWKNVLWCGKMRGKVSFRSRKKGMKYDWEKKKCIRLACKCENSMFRHVQNETGKWALYEKIQPQYRLQLPCKHSNLADSWFTGMSQNGKKVDPFILSVLRFWHVFYVVHIKICCHKVNKLSFWWQFFQTVDTHFRFTKSEKKVTSSFNSTLLWIYL